MDNATPSLEVLEERLLPSALAPSVRVLHHAPLAPVARSMFAIAGDNYDSVQTAFVSVANGGTILFSPGTYAIDRHRIDGPGGNGVTNFVLRDLENVTIDGNGALLQMQGGWTRTADYVHGTHTYSYANCIGLELVNCRNVTIRNLTLDGGATTIIKGATAEGESYGIWLRGCTGVVIENVTVRNYCADGLLIDGSPLPNMKASRNVTVTDSRFLNNARQGMTVTQLRYGTFIRCEFTGNGRAGEYGGHLPMAGVDIEPNYWPTDPYPQYTIDEFTGNLTFRECTFNNNVGWQFVASSFESTPYPVTLAKCSFVGTVKAAVVTGTKLTRFVDCSFTNVALYPDYAMRTPSRTEALRCRFYSTRSDEPMLLLDYAQPSLLVRDCQFIFEGASPPAALTYRIYVQAPRVEFTGNRIYVARHEHRDLGVIALVQKAAKVRGNTWSTDLAGATFYVSYTDAVIVAAEVYAAGFARI